MTSSLACSWVYHGLMSLSLAHDVRLEINPSKAFTISNSIQSRYQFKISIHPCRLQQRQKKQSISCIFQVIKSSQSVTWKSCFCRQHKGKSRNSWCDQHHTWQRDPSQNRDGFFHLVSKYIYFFFHFISFPLGHCSCSLKCKFSGSRIISHFHAVQTTWADFSFGITQQFPSQRRNISMQGVENYSYCRQASHY